MSRQDKVAVISGGSGGLGSSLALALAQDRMRVIVLYHLNRFSAECLVDAIVSAGGNAISRQVDVTDSSSVDAMVDAVLAQFGTIHILVNCAGISTNAISWKVTDKEWRKTVDINLTGCFLCARAVLPVMRTQRWGRIINVTSVVGQIGVPGTVAYSATKTGLIGMTRTMAREVAGQNITVNALALGYFETGIISSVPPNQLEQIVEMIPLRRLGRTEEFVHAVRFLCAEQAAYITGQTLNVNGGLHAG